MKRIMLTVAYDGTAYHGWQVQPNANTIEAELNTALSQLLKENIEVSGASRTDTGVHALCNLAVFDTEARMPAEKVSYAVNTYLPEDIRVLKSEEVSPDFHPRFVPTIKTYEYRIYNGKILDPTKRLYTHFCYYDLDIEKMKRAGAYIVGEHDFAAFCASTAQVKSTVREVTALDISLFDAAGRECGPDDAFSEIRIRVSGKGFLYNMVRIIAGTLIEVGRGAMEAEQVKEAVTKAERELAGPTAPARGLTLVRYEFL